MSLTYAILSVLISNPSSGYDLAKRFNSSVEGSVGVFWNASFQQVYRELNRLFWRRLYHLAETKYHL